MEATLSEYLNLASACFCFFLEAAKDAPVTGSSESARSTRSAADKDARLLRLRLFDDAAFPMVKEEEEEEESSLHGDASCGTLVEGHKTSSPFAS